MFLKIRCPGPDSASWALSLFPLSHHMQLPQTQVQPLCLRMAAWVCRLSGLCLVQAQGMKRIWRLPLVLEATRAARAVFRLAHVTCVSAGSAARLPLRTGVLRQSTPWGRRQGLRGGEWDESGLFLGVGPRAPQSKALKWDWHSGSQAASFIPHGFGHPHPWPALVDWRPQHPGPRPGSARGWQHGTLFLRVLLCLPGTALPPETPFFSPIILYLCSVIKAPTSSSFSSPLSSSGILFLVSFCSVLPMPLSPRPSFSLVSLSLGPFLSQSCLLAQVCTCAHVCASESPLPLHQSCKRGSSSSQKEPRTTQKLQPTACF